MTAEDFANSPIEPPGGDRGCTDGGVPSREAEASLPPPGVLRWVPGRKMQVVAALAEGRLTVEAACRRYGLTPEEIERWQSQARRHGKAGLKITKLNEHRRLERSAAPAAFSPSPPPRGRSRRELWRERLGSAARPDRV